MIFETERLYVRHLRKDDLEALHELYNDPAILEYINPDLTIDETKHILDEQLIQYLQVPQLGRFVILNKINNDFIGLFLLRKNEEREGLEIGYSLRKQDWGKGLATEIVKKGIAYAFTLPYKNVYAITHSKNESSKNVLKKCGFYFEGEIEEDGKIAHLFLLEKED